MKFLRTVAAYAVGGTLGSLCLAYGLREFLRATDGYYRGFDAFLAQGEGAILTFVGRLLLFVVEITFYHDLRAL